jgi:hypothetical protein
MTVAFCRPRTSRAAANNRDSREKDDFIVAALPDFQRSEATTTRSFGDLLGHSSGKPAASLDSYGRRGSSMRKLCLAR